MDWKDIELTDDQLEELKQTGTVTLTSDQMKQLVFKESDFIKHLQLRKEL